MKHSILCVDDEVDNVDALERLFRKTYKVLKATSGAEALKLLAQNPVTVIISDQRMPNMSGVEFLAESIKFHPHSIRILLTGYTDIDSVISAINSGQIYRYVTKPWDPVDLNNAVDKAAQLYEMGAELREKNLALSQALSELQTLDKAKNEFMILVNHELKTPLTALISFTDLLGETRLDEDQKRYLDRIKTASTRLQDMVTDVLEFVSAETAVRKVDLRATRVQNLIAPIPDHIQSQMAHRQLQLKQSLENQSVLADEKLIRNVVRRLLHNAAKFATSGSDVTLTGTSSSGGDYILEIKNKAADMSEATIRHLLKPFTLNEEALHHSTGTGLGLSICQALLRHHSSQLELFSAGGEIRVAFRLRIA